MKRTGGCLIEQFGMSVIYRIFFPCGVQNQYGIKFKPFGVLYWEYHDAVSEYCRFQVTFHNLYILPQRFCGEVCAVLVPAYHGNGIKTAFLPFPADMGCFADEVAVMGFYAGRRFCTLLHSHRAAMADNGFHRIA